MSTAASDDPEDASFQPYWLDLVWWKQLVLLLGLGVVTFFLVTALHLISFPDRAVQFVSLALAIAAHHLAANAWRDDYAVQWSDARQGLVWGLAAAVCLELIYLVYPLP
jgi:hypothetical protein